MQKKKQSTGQRKRPGLEKWTPAQHKKFRATMAAKRKEREAAAKTAAKSNGSNGLNGHGQLIPLDAIPERGTPLPRYQHKPQRFIPQDNHELATDLLRIAVAMLKGRP